jgi:hypothetical protein
MAKSLDEFTVILPTRDELLNIHNFLESVPNSMPSIVIDVRHVTTPYKTSKYYNRLEMGLKRKTLHSILRSTLL